MTKYSEKTLGNILKHDSKITSYKIALLRAINDVALSYPDMVRYGDDIAIPLRYLAEYWISYYWPFVRQENPIWQGNRRSLGNGGLANDMAFRDELTALRNAWDKIWQGSEPSDGFFLINEMHVQRKRKEYNLEFMSKYKRAISEIAESIKKPIQHAGPGSTNWHIFDKPKPLKEIRKRVNAVPGTREDDRCLIVPRKLYGIFVEMSLWIEALCIHEWSLFVEGVEQHNGEPKHRGEIYKLLTARPDNRRPLTWERNKIELLLMEGTTFTCPWTGKNIARNTKFDIDHILPVSVYPINEMWNLVPSDPRFNTNTKRNRIPDRDKLEKAKDPLSSTYAIYQSADSLSGPLHSDIINRFYQFREDSLIEPRDISNAVVRYINTVADSRNLERF